MPVEWEFTGADAAPGPDEELGDGERRSRLTRWLRRVPRAGWAALAALAVGSLALAAVTAVATQPRPGTAPRTPAATAATVGATAAAVRPAPDAALALVRHLALQPGPLAIYIRETAVAGACPLVEPGTSPQGRISTALRRALPRFRVTDVGYTLDPFSALCVMQLRARDDAGSVLVVNVVAPRPSAADVREKLINSVVSDGVTETRYAFAVSSDGWKVTVGSTGEAAGQPATKYLRALAQDPTLHW